MGLCVGLCVGLNMGMNDQPLAARRRSQGCLRHRTNDCSSTRPQELVAYEAVHELGPVGPRRRELHHA